MVLRENLMLYDNLLWDGVNLFGYTSFLVQSVVYFCSQKLIDQSLASVMKDI